MIVSVRGCWGLGKFCVHHSKKAGLGVGIRAGVILSLLFPTNEAETELIVFGGFHEYSLEKLKKAK